MKYIGFLLKIGFSIGLKFFSISLGILIYRWLNQNLSIGDLSNLNIITAYIAVITGIIQLGIPTLVQKYYTNLSDDLEKYKKWTELNLIRFISFFLGLFLIFCTYKIFGIYDFSLVFIIYCTQFILITDLSYRSVLDVYNQSWKYSLTDLIGRFILVVSIYSISKGVFTVGLTSLFTIYLLFNLISVIFPFIIDFFWHFKKTRPTSFSVEYLLQDLKPMLILGISALLAGVFMTTDKLFLKNFGFSDTVINGYSNAYKLFELSMVIPGLSIPIIATRVKAKADLIKISKDKRIFIFKVLSIVSAVGLFVGVGFYILSPAFLKLIDPKSLYIDNSLQYLIFFAISLVCVFGSQLISSVTIFYSKEKYEIFIFLFHAIVGLTLYYILIGNYGAYGAALTTMIIFIEDITIRIILLFKIFPVDK